MWFYFLRLVFQKFLILFGVVVVIFECDYFFFSIISLKSFDIFFFMFFKSFVNSYDFSYFYSGQCLLDFNGKQFCWLFLLFFYAGLVKVLMRCWRFSLCSLSFYASCFCFSYLLKEEPAWCSKVWTGLDNKVVGFRVSWV